MDKNNLSNLSRGLLIVVYSDYQTVVYGAG